MTRNRKTKFASFFPLLIAIILCFAFFAAPVSAEDGQGSPEQKGKEIKLMYLKGANDTASESEPVVPVCRNGRWIRLHSDPRVSESNFVLSPEQKEYAITECEKVASEIRDSSKSDLERYYKLAIWLNKYVNYDWEFWPGGYDLAYYSHQWDVYGVMKEQKSICAGIAVTYATLCHAADLPCKFVRMKPRNLDHTINYIPDINGHAYYIDVTENLMFMSKKANPWNPMDIGFSCIEKSKIPDDGSFEYSEGDSLMPSSIKDYYDTPFDDWFKEYALHEDTEKVFKTKYVEKGSGNGETHASYNDYPKQFSYTEKPGIWFLEDFYQDPKTIETKILNKELDEQLLNISGMKENYDCDTPEELASVVAGDMAVKYFPSSEDGKVVAKAAGLTVGKDYTVTCDIFDPSTGEAKLTIEGIGEYRGDYQIPVRIHSAAVTKAPANKKLAYAGEPQALVEPGEAAENSKILYAARKFDDSKAYPDIFDNNASDPKNAPDPEQFSDEIPAATDAGRYEVWYKIEGAEGHRDVQPQRLKGVAVIAPLESKILAEDITIKADETFQLTPVLDTGMEATFWFLNCDDKVISVSNDGVVKGVAEGTAAIIITAKLKHPDPNCAEPTECDIKVTVTDDRPVNPMTLEGKTVKVKHSKIKSKAITIKQAKAITVNNAQGEVAYKLVTAKKGKKNFKKYFKINAKTGNVTVKKGLKKGKYTVKAKVRASGNNNYQPSDWNIVTFNVQVK